MNTNEFLFKKLEEKGLKQADLAKELNVEKSVITSWKRRGNDLPSKYLMQICTFLEVSIQELLGIENNDFDSKLLAAYHNANDGTKKAICKLLDIKEEKSSNLYTTKIG